MISQDGRFVVVFNGEIYNYSQLRKELESDGTCFRTTSDTEVLLHLYARKGAEMVHQLRGMFAFAIWDQERRRLFLARDPYGIKPLYTSNDGWTFRFASQVKALLAGGQVSRDPEPAGLVGFHLFGSVPEPFSLYRDIHSLPAGHTQWVDEIGPKEPKPYSNLAAVLAEGAANPVQRDDLYERVRAAVRDSVREHLIADVEVGIFLSAGIDSGALLGLMRDAGKKDIRAITLAFAEFQGTSEDEAPLAARVCEHYGARHIVRSVSEQEFRDDLPAILEAMDQPSIDGVNSWFVSKAAKEAGLKVAISGLGGDELLGGYPSFSDLPRWRQWFGPIASVPGLGHIARKVIGGIAPSLSRGRPKLLGVLEHSSTWAGVYLLRRGLFLPSELSTVMDAEIAHEGLRRLKPLRRLGNSLMPDPGHDASRVCVLESAHYMRNQLLRDADWVGMAHSLEIRVPLVDFTLLRALAPVIPVLSAGSGKAALAKAPAKPLPNDIVNRAKTGFNVPTGDWINTAIHGSDPGVIPSAAKGLISRHWSRAILKGMAPAKARQQTHAA
jgi:asparagine synthase (glutamine-hydrolysing)